MHGNRKIDRTFRDTAGDAAALTLTASGRGYGEALAIRVSVSVSDDDTAGLSIMSTVLSLVQNGISTYVVSLTSQASAKVTVTNASDNPDVTLSPVTLTFTLDNWDMAQAVPVTARVDEGGGDELATVLVTASGGGCDGLRRAVCASVDDMLTRLPGAPAGMGIYAPAGAMAGVNVTVAPPASGTPKVTTGFGDLVAVSVTNAPNDGLEICLPVSSELRAAAGSALTMTLLSHAAGAWTEIAGAWD